VNHREEFPLCAYLLLTSEGETSYAFVLDVDEDRFDRAHPATVKFSPERCIEIPSHALHGFVALTSTLRAWTFWVLDDRELTLR
jgi:hypothetical protein